MKKAILIGTTALLLVSANIVFRAPEKAVSQLEGPTIATNITELINDIAVPYNVLLDAQMEHSGYAVTSASKGIREGRDVYRLHIETSDTTSSRRNLYLIYSLQWQLIGEETSFTPAAAPKQEITPVEEPAEATAQPDDVEEAELVPVEPEEPVEVAPSESAEPETPASQRPRD